MIGKDLLTLMRTYSSDEMRHRQTYSLVQATIFCTTNAAHFLALHKWEFQGKARDD